MSRDHKIMGTMTVADCLRRMARRSEDGALLGSENALIAAIGTSRATLRQAARLVEREGLLKVRRGVHGGYFATRTGISAIEYAVGVCLEMLDVDPRDLTALASNLWVQALRSAAGVQANAAQAVVSHFRRKLDELRPKPSYEEVVGFERQFRKAIFELINTPYIELVFNINAAYAYKAFRVGHGGDDDIDSHQEFVKAWRQEKYAELEALALGDRALAMMAARATRNTWRQQVWK